MPVDRPNADRKYVCFNFEPIQDLDSNSFVSGEMIQKAEIDLKPDYLVTVLPSLGSEFKIRFDLLINNFQSSTWYSVLLFTVDRGLPGSIKYGERHPGIFVKDGHIYIKAAVNGNSNYLKRFQIVVDKWMHLKIVQKVLNNKGRHNFFFGLFNKSSNCC